MLKKMWSDGLNAFPDYFNDYETTRFCFDDDGGDGGGGGPTSSDVSSQVDTFSSISEQTGDTFGGDSGQQYDDYAATDFLEPTESQVDEMMFGPEVGGRLGFWDGLTGGTYDGVASQTPAYGYGETAGDVAIGALTGLATGGPMGALVGGARGAATGPAIRGALEGDKAYSPGYSAEQRTESSYLGAPTYSDDRSAFGDDGGQGETRRKARASTYLSAPYQKETRGSLTGGPQISSWAQWGANR